MAEATIVQCEFSVIQRESGFISDACLRINRNVTEQEKIDHERHELRIERFHELHVPH